MTLQTASRAMRVGMALVQARRVSALVDVQLGATPLQRLQPALLQTAVSRVLWDCTLPQREVLISVTALRATPVAMVMLVVLSANVQELVLLGATPLRQLPLARQHQIASVVMQAPSFPPLVARARTIALIVPSVSTSM